MIQNVVKLNPKMHDNKNKHYNGITFTWFSLLQRKYSAIMSKTGQAFFFF